MRRSIGLSLLLLFGAPLLLAQDGPNTEAVSDTCAHPVSILWNDEPRDGTGALAVSVTDPKTGQQIPQLPGDAFSLSIDDKGKGSATIVEVSQTREALARLENSPDGVRYTIESDPVSVDAFFAVDLSRSMETPRPQQEGPARSNRETAVSLIERITDDKPNQGPSLLGLGTRILVSGFDDQLHTELMRDLTGESAAVRSALAALFEYSPRSENTALFAAIERSLTLIERLAPSYREMKRRREAVLFVITDSFNGRDLEAGRNLSRCNQNDALTDSLVERIEAVRRATDEGLRVYILALGEEGEARGYSPNSPAKRRCRPTNAQKNTVDGYNFRRLTDPALGVGGNIASTSEDAIFEFVQKEFQLRRRAYKISYQLPEGARSPSRYQLNVRRNGVTCSASVRSSSDIVPTIAAGSDLETRPAEMALFLASLLISMLFAPRAITNLRASLKRNG